ncbi:MAG TPA: dockerin type I domain-containing protein, partial [Phycisphaerae bacterium]|nr:dockerin type I domain-containing protein [Phycisphaerae bacterium]
DLYRVTLTTVGQGATSVSLARAAESKFAASTPRGVKLGHAADNGNPGGASYPTALQLVVQGGQPCAGDVNGDGRTDQSDLGILLASFGLTVPPGTNGDLNGDGVVNQSDLGILLAAFGCGT